MAAFAIKQDHYCQAEASLCRFSSIKKDDILSIWYNDDPIESDGSKTLVSKGLVTKTRRKLQRPNAAVLSWWGIPPGEVGNIL